MKWLVDALLRDFGLVRRAKYEGLREAIAEIREEVAAMRAEEHQRRSAASRKGWETKKARKES